MYGTRANDDDDPAVGSVQYSMNVLACPGHDALCAERQRKLPQNLRWGRQFLNATDAQIVRVFVNNRPLRHHPKMIPERHHAWNRSTTPALALRNRLTQQKISGTASTQPRPLAIWRSPIVQPARARSSRSRLWRSFPGARRVMGPPFFRSCARLHAAPCVRSQASTRPLGAPSARLEFEARFPCAPAPPLPAMSPSLLEHASGIPRQVPFLAQHAPRLAEGV